MRFSSCCNKFELLGFLMTIGALSTDEGKYTSKNELVFNRFVRLKNEVLTDRVGRITVSGQKEKTYACVFSHEEILSLKSLYPTSPEDLEQYISNASACCKSAFVRGVFLCGGFLADPQKRFHLEISLASHTDTEGMLAAFYALGILTKESMRNGQVLLYLKKADDIADFLAFIGLQQEAFHYVNSGIEKNVLNTVNRQMNCESGNLNKRLNAAEKQLEAIEYFQERSYTGLSQSLIDMAKIRLENPAANLNELAELMSISKSGAAHRLHKIIKLYEENR